MPFYTVHASESITKQILTVLQRSFVEDDPILTDPFAGSAFAYDVEDLPDASVCRAENRHRRKEETPPHKTGAIKLSVKIIFDIEAESTQDAAEQIHGGFHDVAAYGEELSKQVGYVFDQNQKAAEKRKKVRQGGA
jgi:hypothetical protein